MDAMLGFMELLVIFFIFALLWKYRREIKRFVSEKHYGETWRPERKTILKRKIEDANAELIWLNEQELTKAETGGKGR